MSSLATRVFEPRTHGLAAWATTAVRVITGVLFVTFSLGKFVDHAKETADFERYGIPEPEVATYLVGTLELVCGALLVVGLLTRPAALLLAANLIGAISTAGRVEGGTFHLGVGPAMLLAMLFLVWAGPGRLALDRLLPVVRSAHSVPAGDHGRSPYSPGRVDRRRTAAHSESRGANG